MRVWSLVWLSGLRILHSHKLWCGLDPVLLWLWHCLRCCSNLTPGLGTSMCCRCSCKKKKKIPPHICYIYIHFKILVALCVSSLALVPSFFGLSFLSVYERPVYKPEMVFFLAQLPDIKFGDFAFFLVALFHPWSPNFAFCVPLLSKPNLPSFEIDLPPSI